MEEMLDLHELKPWLREDIGKSIHDWVATQSKETVLYYSQPIVNRLARKEFASSPEGLAIWLELRDKAPQSDLSTHVWNSQNSNPIEDIPQLTKMLLRKQELVDADRASQKKTEAVGSRQVTPHFAWNVILRSLIREDEQRGYRKHNQGSRYAQFWEDAVNRELLLFTFARHVLIV